jgi:hypothetical protein
MSSSAFDQKPASNGSVQPIFDASSVFSSERVTFHLGTVARHPENPLLIPGEPQEWDGLQVTWPGTVLYDEVDQRFRCWYSGLDAVQSNRPPLWLPGYAESEDGIHWTKPSLGQYTHRGVPTNRIVVNWKPWILSLVLRNPDPTDQQRKFLSLWVDENIRGKSLASSADGKSWRREKIAYRSPGPDRNSFNDIAQLLFEPNARDPEFRVIGYGQVMRPRWDEKVVRQIGLVHGRDFGDIRDADEVVALAPQPGIEEELHFASVKKIGDTFVMLFESDRFSNKPLRGDLRLAVSADGRKFRRVHQDTPLVSTGAKGMWDENLLVTSTSAMQEVGDEIRIYYFGCPNVYTRWPGAYALNGNLRGSLFYPSYLGLATLPRDRFAYAAGPGELTTKPMEVSGDVWLNAEGDEVIKVAALDGSGRAVFKGRLGNERSQTVYRKVDWTGSKPKGRLQFRISLGDACKLYSVRC